jgi:ABC-type transport system substrate-binding protein
MNHRTRAVVASGLAVTALLTAAGTGVTPALATTLAPAATSLKTLVIGSPQAPPTLDPTANAAAAIDEVVDYNVLQHLVQLAPDGKIVPVLAPSVSPWSTWNDSPRTALAHPRPGRRAEDGDGDGERRP